MKKFLGVCLSLVLFASCCGVLVGCGEERFQISDGTGSSNNTTNLADFYVNITDASSLGVAQIDGTMKLIKTSKLLLADDTSEPSYTEVEYTDENGDLFDIDKSGLEVYQMYVTPDYTFVSYISQNIREFAKKGVFYTDNSVDCVYYSKSSDNIETNMFYFEVDANGYYFYDTNRNMPENFNKVNYKNNNYQNSYIINNATGKIYNTAEMLSGINGEYFNIENNLLYVKHEYDISNKRVYDYYDFYINEQDELVVTQLLPNSDVNILDAFKDKDGYIYVSNSSLNTFDTEKNILYTTQKLVFGSDGYVYEDNNQPQLYRLNGNNREMLTSCDDVVFENGDYLKQVLNGVLYTNYLGFSESNNALKCYNISNNFAELSAFVGNGFDVESNIIYSFRNDGLYVFNDCDVPNNYLGEATKILGVCDFNPRYIYLDNGIIKFEKVIKEVTPSETNYYKFGKDENGDATLIKLANTQYTGTIITLQPIN